MLASKMKILEPVQPKSKIRNREIRGPQIHTFGVIEKKFHSSAAQKNALKCMQREQWLRQAEEDAMQEKFARERLKWEDVTEQKIFINNVKTEINKHLKNEQFDLEARQEQLRQLLSQEEEEYFNLLEQNEETPLQRQEAMKQRAKILKDKREAERLKLVQEKLDQQFRLQCAPLREAQSKRILNEICSERQEQIAMHEEANREKQAVDDMYANLWREDSQKKIANEEHLAKERQQRSKDLATELRNQMAQLDENKQKEEKLKEEELRLLKEQMALQKVEEQQALEEKRKKQQQKKEELDKTLQYRLKRKAKMEQEEIAFDIKIMENLMKDSHSERQTQRQKKRERQEENEKYLTHLRKLLAEEKAREREMQRIIDEDVEKQWQKRLDKWQQEKEARRRLINDVMRIRSRQLMDRLVENNKQREESEQEKQEVLQRIEAYKRDQAEEIARQRDKILQYRHDLQGQIYFNKRQLEKQKAIEAEEHKKEMQTEMELQQKINEVLSMPFSNQNTPVHPMRRALSK